VPIAVSDPIAVAAETGLADSYWITQVREALGDRPMPKTNTWTADAVNGVFAAGGTPLVVNPKPIYDQAGGISVGVAPLQGQALVNYPLSTVNPPAAGQVYVDYGAGLVYFNSAPALNSYVVIGYQYVKFTDQAIINALYAGLRAMFPVVGKVSADTTNTILVNTWDYPLPAFLTDPRSRVLRVDIIATDVMTEPYKPIYDWYRTGIDQITIPRAQAWSPTARIKITGWGPYQWLGDLEPQVSRLPIWYALGVLFGNREGQDRRKDAQVPAAQEAASQQLQQLQMARHYMNLFEQELRRLAKVPGPGTHRRLRTTYDRDNYGGVG
jgi:hypothetical protein